MAGTEIQPHRILSPFQMIAAILALLVLTDGLFLGAAATIPDPFWISPMLVVASVILTFLGVAAVVVMQTRFRDRLLSDELYVSLVRGQNEQNKRLSQTRRDFESQQDLINELVVASMSDAIFRHLVGISILNEYRYSQEREYDLYQREFYHLKDHGFIGPPEREFYKAMNGMNLVRVVTPTPLGQEYIKLRVELRGLDVIRDWLEPNKRENLNVDAARKLGINLLNTQ